jgi:hypothetical protein
MGVPVPWRLLDRFAPLSPGLKTASCEGEGAERLPPRCTEVERGRILRLQDKRPTGVGQTPPPDIGCTMDLHMIHKGVESLDLCGAPPRDLPTAVHPSMDRAPQIVLGQRLPSRWTKRPAAGALPPSSIVHRLRGPGGRSGRCSGGGRAYP